MCGLNDFRLVDHPPLQSAIQEGRPLLLLYIQEPELWEDEHMDLRHNKCIYRAIQSINDELVAFNQRIVVMEGIRHQSSNTSINATRYTVCFLIKKQG